MLFRTKNKKMSSEPALSGEKAIRRAMVADGRVQGVGFRYFARSLAREHGVTGWVMNMPDGTVAMEVQGPEDRVDSFAGAISNPPTDWYIRVTSLKIRNIPLVPDESGFAIRFYGQRFCPCHPGKLNGAAQDLFSTARPSAPVFHRGKPLEGQRGRVLLGLLHAGALRRKFPASGKKDA